MQSDKAIQIQKLKKHNFFTTKATPICLFGLRIRRLKLWANGKKIKVLCDPSFKIIFIFYYFRRWKNWHSVLFLFLLSQLTDIWSSFGGSAGWIFKSHSQLSNKYTSMAAPFYIFYFYFFPSYHFQNTTLFFQPDRIFYII